MNQLRSPRRRAAWTYSRSRSASTAERTVRAIVGVNRMAMTRMITATDAPSPDTMTMPAITTGMASSTSTARISTSSTTPRKKPAMRPMAVPHRSASSVASGATASTGRAPASVRDNTSRPRSSVPNQCAELGGASVFSGSTSSAP